MKQEERQLWKSVRLSGEKTKLELEKMEYLLADLQGFLQRIEQDHPELYLRIDLHRVWVELRNLRLQCRRAREVQKYLLEGIRALARMRRDGSGPSARYPGMAYPSGQICRTVAEEKPAPFFVDPTVSFEENKVQG